MPIAALYKNRLIEWLKSAKKEDLIKKTGRA